MNDHENIERAVAKIDGRKKGNALLVDKGHAITVRHCVTGEGCEREQEIKLVFPKLVLGKEITVSAVMADGFDPIGDQLVLLVLKEEVEAPEILFGSVRLQPSDRARVYGYDANFPEGRWTDLISGASVIQDPELVQDMLFDAVNSKEKDFAGLSGSPVIMAGYVIGLISQETMETGEAIGIHGISMQSGREFMSSCGIPVEELSGVYYRTEGKLSAGACRQQPGCITAAADLEYGSRLQGKYREKLADISAMHRRGDVEGAWKELKKQVVEFGSSPAVADEVRAEYHLKMALWYLEDKQDTGRAQRNFEKACKYNQGTETKIFQAIKLYREGNQNAEDLLEPVTTAAGFNAYLQICLNTQKTEKAFEKYEEIDGTIQEDSGTWYLLGIMDIFRREYDEGMQYISRAIEMDGRVPLYYLMRGILQYRKALPRDVCQDNELYPRLFTNSLFHLEKEKHQLIEAARADYQKAYYLAESVENRKMMQLILSVWIHTLSVDSRFQNMVLEPIQMLKKLDLLNVSLLLYQIHNRMKLDEEVTVQKLEERLAKDPSKINYVIVLVEFCLQRGDRKKAKQYLHEYKSLFSQGDSLQCWYEYISLAEEQKEKLFVYEEEIRGNNVLGSADKKRLLCLYMQFDGEREQELEELLKELYEETHNRLDLLNLILFYRQQKSWAAMERCADTLRRRFEDSSGDFYRLAALIELEKYEEALRLEEALELQQGEEAFEELNYRKMLLFERMGKYTEAAEAGMRLLYRKPTEQLTRKVSGLYILDGDDTKALSVLLQAEGKEYFSVEICKLISGCYLSIDEGKAWRYAKRAVELSGDQPEVMLWAANIGFRTDRSDQASLYIQRVATEYPNHQLKTVKSLDEVLEIIQESREYRDKNLQLLQDGEINSHIFVDTYNGNMTYAEYFYLQWEGKDMFPLESGVHYYTEEALKMPIREMILDYSSCLLLHELGLLETLAEYMEHTYIAGELLGIISEELRRIPEIQKELTEKKYALMTYCTGELRTAVVEEEIPENMEAYDAMGRVNACLKLTAERNKAVWVSDTDQSDGSIRPMEVITACYREGMISEEGFRSCCSGKPQIREEKIRYLLEEHPKILADGVILQEWADLSVLCEVNDSYPVILTREMMESSEREYQKMQQKERICSRLEKLKSTLLRLKRNGRLVSLPVMAERDDMLYSGMLKSLLISSQKRKLPLCADDRFLTGYPCVGGASVYNTFDMMKLLLLSQKITVEKFSSLHKRLYDARVRYILPDNRFLLYAIRRSRADRDRKRLAESETLTAIRKYVVEAFSEQSMLSHKKAPHAYLPEWECFLLYLQSVSRDLLREIWTSDMEEVKKYAASEWILHHYSQFAFDFGENAGVKERKRIEAIRIAGFIVGGCLIFEDRNVELYFKWMYEWTGIYLKNNPDIKESALNYAKELILSYLQSCQKKDKNEFYLTERMFSTGIFYMPQEYRAMMLENKRISRMYYGVYSVYTVSLTPERQIPLKLFQEWKGEILALKEKERRTKVYENISYQLYWEDIYPALSALVIGWQEGGKCCIQKLCLEPGERMMHAQKRVREEELRKIDGYLDDGEYREEYMAVRNRGTGTKAAEKIISLLERSEAYEMTKTECGLKNRFLNDKKLRKYMFPGRSDYFKRLYDCTKKQEYQEASKIRAALPVSLDGSCEAVDCSNHNPVRSLHRLARLIRQRAGAEEIYTLAASLFSFVGGENERYGKAYMLFLKGAWEMFLTSEGYEKEPEENRIFWSYLWADRAMSCMSRLEEQGEVEPESFVSQLEEDMGIDVATNSFCCMEETDVLSPEYMNLFKLCVTGTLMLCSGAESLIPETAGNILIYIKENISRWMSENGYVREAELSHKRDINQYNSIFTGDFYSLVSEIFRRTGADESKKDLITIEDRIQNHLQYILEGETLGMQELSYLFLMYRGEPDPGYADAVIRIIKKHVMEKPFTADPVRYRALSYLIIKLPDSFQQEYLRHEMDRTAAFLLENPESWESVYDIAEDISQIDFPESFLAFWEEYEREVKGNVELQLAERIAGLKFTLPYEYEERIRKLRIRLELKPSR